MKIHREKPNFEKKKVFPGRPKGVLGKSRLDEHRHEIETMFARGETIIDIAEYYDFTPSGVKHWAMTRGLIEA